MVGTRGSSPYDFEPDGVREEVCVHVLRTRFPLSILAKTYDPVNYLLAYILEVCSFFRSPWLLSDGSTRRVPKPRSPLLPIWTSSHSSWFVASFVASRDDGTENAQLTRIAGFLKMSPKQLHS